MGEGHGASQCCPCAYGGWGGGGLAQGLGGWLGWPVAAPIGLSWGGGGGISWPFASAWEILRVKLTAKFPTRNLEFSADFSHTSGTHLWTLAGGTTQNPGGSAILPTAKFATANLTWGQIPPPPPARPL